MTRTPFFPDAGFGWTFCTVLILLTAAAAWSDIRSAKIPNRLTVVILALGLIASAVRGGLLAANEMQVWWLWKYDPGVTWLGVIDGLLFGATGFLVAFAAMFCCWAFGLCGGGDVKLFAAIGGWVGAAWFPLVWLASIGFLFVWAVARLFVGGLAPKQVQKSLKKSGSQTARRNAEAVAAGRPGKFRVTYSLPISLATAVVLLWVFRVELQLAPPKPQPGQTQGASHHDRSSAPVAG